MNPDERKARFDIQSTSESSMVPSSLTLIKPVPKGDLTYLVSVQLKL